MSPPFLLNLHKQTLHMFLHLKSHSIHFLLPPVVASIYLTCSCVSVFASFPEPGDVPQPRGGLDNSRRSQNHRGAAQTGEEAPGGRVLTGGKGKVPAHSEPLLQGCRPPLQPGRLHPGPLQHAAPRPDAELGQTRGRAEGEVQGGQLQPVQQERPSTAQERKREFQTDDGVTAHLSGRRG